MPLGSEVVSDRQWPPRPRPDESIPHEEGIDIKALNHDNQFDAEELVQLFRSHFGESYPFTQVYDPAFWRSDTDQIESEEKFTSIVAVEDKRIIAHLAIQHDPISNTVELLHPAIHPDYRYRLFGISRLFWRCIQEQAKRQNWQVLFGYSFVSQPLAQVLAAKCLHLSETALIPNDGPEAAGGLRPPSGRTSLLAMYNTPIPSDSPVLTIFPPSYHLPKIRELYRPFSLNRKILDIEALSEAGTEAPAFAANGTSPSTPFFVCYENGLGICRAMIVPSQLDSWEESMDYLEELRELVEAQDLRLVVEVALDDPACPKCSRMLESIGYRFCGILPELNGHDFIVYARYTDSELKSLSLYTSRAKRLRDYMLHLSQGSEDFRFL